MAKKINTDSDKAQARYDSYMNALTGLGGLADKSLRTKFLYAPILQDEVLTEMYLGDGFSKKIVTQVADDMTRNWITIPGDPSGKIIKEMARLKAQSKYNEALDWQRLYRGGLIHVGALDGGELDKPLVPEKVKEIAYMNVYSAMDVNMATTDFVTDVNSEYYNSIEIFKIRGENGVPFSVHRSRLLLFFGE
ncbi:hypothetical protein LCGC14_1369640, partial [marine sediment metagenome]